MKPERMEYIISTDQRRMNWFRNDFEYAKVTVPAWLSLEVSVSHSRDGDLLKTSIVMKNVSEKLCMIQDNEVSVSFPLEDRYDSSEICLHKRCHAHVFCGENISYICAMRMGGEAPHLGMVLTKGSLSGYSIERDENRMSNDRGCFLLHPSPVELQPGDEEQIEWMIFPHQGWDDFYAQIPRYRRFVDVSAKKYVLLPGETIRLNIVPSFAAEAVNVQTKTGEMLPVKRGKDSFTVEIPSDAAGITAGENRLEIEAGGIRTYCSLLLYDDPDRVAMTRCRYIAIHQQYQGSYAPLRGAYLAYDCAHHTIDYSSLNDHNAGRERVGMGLLMAKYLQRHRDDTLEKSLQDYIAFVLRELVDAHTGTVANDYGMDTSYSRLYNAPWYAMLFLELYRLFSDKEYLIIAEMIMRTYYRQGGGRHYSIEVPGAALCTALKEAGLEQDSAEIRALIINHADYIMKNDVNYPPHEVNFEQSIVAPAAWILLDAYHLTQDSSYLRAAGKQIKILELFNGRQPDHHLYETAIRHWDGYWFGKEKMFGDTFPHYWSSLTGNCMLRYGEYTGNRMYTERAEASLRSPLALIFPDGEASCAYIYPQTVNGKPAAFYDSCANDQDWAMYYFLRYMDQIC